MVEFALTVSGIDEIRRFASPDDIPKLACYNVRRSKEIRT
jgi:hypothetical protein